MFEMPYARCHHGHSQSIGSDHRILVLDGTSRLDHGCNTGLMGDFNAIRKREKCIAGHDGSLQIKAEVASLGDCLLKRIDSRSLPGTTGKQLFSFG